MVEQKSFDVIEQLKKDIAVATKTKAEAEAAAGTAKGDLEAKMCSTMKIRDGIDFEIRALQDPVLKLTATPS